MNKVLTKICAPNGCKGLATTADIFAGTTKTKAKVQRSNLPLPTYGGRHIVTMLPGIGSGPKMMEYLQDVFKKAYIPIDFEIIGDVDLQRDDQIQLSLTSILRNGIGIKGHIPALADTSSNVTLRSHLDLYVYLVHCKSYPKIRSRVPDIDIVVFRQNTEGEYAMLEHESKPGVVESLKIITKSNTERFARWAFEFATQEGRKKVTVVHKANIMKVSDGLFLKTVLDVAKEYPDIEVNDLIVDNCSMQLVSKPHSFDVILTPNLYGNIIISIICGLLGGPGLMSGQNYSDTSAVFEVASRQISFDDEKYVNPVAILNAGVDMLTYLKKDAHAELIRNAIRKTLVEDQIHTPDIGGTNTGSEMVDSIKKNIDEGLKTAKISTF